MASDETDDRIVYNNNAGTCDTILSAHRSMPDKTVICYDFYNVGLIK